NIYSTRSYYKRVRQLLLNYNRVYNSQKQINISLIRAFLKSMFVIGFVENGRREYWKLIGWTLFNRPKLMVDAITCTVYGYHFRTVYGLREKSNI
ncbi:MAG TPA: DUF4070 domain-containing protein, partial [Draconibacterium sp.]|nr:DUF4070 domain-containing protein [Draconibacterium sp.]